MLPTTAVGAPRSVFALVTGFLFSFEEPRAP